MNGGIRRQHSKGHPSYPTMDCLYLSRKLSLRMSNDLFNLFSHIKSRYTESAPPESYDSAGVTNIRYENTVGTACNIDIPNYITLYRFSMNLEHVFHSGVII